MSAHDRICLVTGGTGFLGSALVRRLVEEGRRVRVLDNNSRGRVRRLHDLLDRIEYVEGDIRDAKVVREAVSGVYTVCHLAYVNGTEFFYSKPDLVLDVGIRGMLNVVDACAECTTPELIVASSSEVYQHPSQIPTDESVPLVIPDPFNPRFTYGAGKMISELMTFHWASRICKRVVVFRPHNVYGPDMGWEHVIPQVVTRMRALGESHADPLDFPIQGDGRDTRAFIFLEDFVNALVRVMDVGESMGLYHIGTQVETSIADLVHEIAALVGRKVELRATLRPQGGTPRRCPDIGRLRRLGFEPKYSLREGLAKTVPWYWENADQAPRKSDESRLTSRTESP